MRRALLLPLVLSSCFNPDDVLPLHGSVSSPDSMVGQPVQLLREAVPEGNQPCHATKAFKETTSDEAGNYSFDVFRAQGQSLTGLTRICFRAQALFPSGSVAYSDLPGLSAERTLPPFPDWRAAPTFEGEVLRFQPAAPLPNEELVLGNPLTHRAEWFTEDGGLAWVMDDLVLAGGAAVRQPMVLGEYAREDFSGALQVRARLTELKEEGAGPFASTTATVVEAVAGERLSLSGTRQPMSRGLPCPALGSPCPLTDGDLTAADAGGLSSLTLTLTSPRPVVAAVLRGVEAGTPQLTLSLHDADGGLLLPLERVLPTSLWRGARIQRGPRGDGGILLTPEPTYAVVTFDAGAPVGSVTLTFPGGLNRISEISLFE